MTFETPFPHACISQFEQSRSAAEELQQYLVDKSAEAREAEARALAKADDGACRLFSACPRNFGHTSRRLCMSSPGIVLAITLSQNTQAATLYSDALCIPRIYHQAPSPAVLVQPWLTQVESLEC